MSLVDDAFKKATVGLDIRKERVGRLRGAFMRMRAVFLDKTFAHWDVSTLAEHLKKELTAVESYLKDNKTVALIKGTETKTPAHLDLRTAASLTGEDEFEATEKKYRANRESWVFQIVWRAVAIHPQLWKLDAPSPALEQAALDEILDRRLRVVEQMTCNVNSVLFGSKYRPWDVKVCQKVDKTVPDCPEGPWYDGIESRNFEYPSVEPVEPFIPLLPKMRMSGWTYDFNDIQYNPPDGDRTHFRNDIRAAWKLEPTGTRAWIDYQPTALTASDVIQRMFGLPRKDFWDRNWLFCDHVGSLVNIEALWFGNRRRANNDDAFEKVMKIPRYVRLGPVVDGGKDQLMADVSDKFFENLGIDINLLQVGDFVRFWNNRVYDLLPPKPGAWGSEFSFVMGVDVDGSTGKVLNHLTGGPQVLLAGHGMETMLYNSMATAATNHLTERFLLARVLLSAKLAVDPSTDNFPNVGGKSVSLVLWSPYEPFDPPGAWWVKIPKAVWENDWRYATVDDVIKGVPRTVAHDSVGGAGYNAPPEKNAVYFPLFEPAVGHTGTDGDSWRAYLRKRKADANFRPSSKQLRELAVDGRLAQGLYYRGPQEQKIPCVRPKVRT